MRQINGKTSIAIFAFAGFIGASAPAAAQDTGFYVGASLGAAKAKQICGNAANCDPDETAIKGLVGYQLHRNLAVEGGYQYFGMFSRDSRGLSASALDAVAVGSWPVMNQLAVYGKAGVYFADMKSKPLGEQNSGLTYGLGAEYALSPTIGLRGEWQRYDNVGGGDLGFKTDIDVLSAAIVWRPK